MDIGILVAAAIPFKSFKEQIRLTKQYERKRVSVYKDFIIIDFRQRVRK